MGSGINLYGVLMMNHSFEYGDDKEIGFKEILFSIPSWTIAVGLLSIPRSITSATQSSDAWIPLLISGIITILFCWIVVKLAFKFPKQDFLQYTGEIVSKPVAYLITSLLGVYFLLWTTYEIRALSVMANIYLFDQTPLEVIALIFLLVIIYAVSGTTAALLRLNLLFLPIVIAIALLVLILNYGYFEKENFKPVFSTGSMGILTGIKESLFAFVGFEFLLFYIPLLNRSKGAVRLAVVGMGIPVILYIFFTLMAIGVFGVEATQQIMYPSIELAKEVEVPGGFLERFDSLFFTIWVMAIFNTTAIGYSVSLLAFQSIIPRVKKMTWIFVLSPIIYLMVMSPKDFLQVNQLSVYLSYAGIVFSAVIPTMLLLIAKLRGIGSKREK